MTPALLSSITAADSRGDAAVLVKLFLIAIVIVAPYGVWQLRQLRRRRVTGVDATLPEPAGPRRRDAVDDAATTGGAGVADPDNLRTAIDRIDADADALRTDPDRAFEVVLNGRTHVDGSHLPRAILESLVSDAAARNRVPISWLVHADVDGGRRVRIGVARDGPEPATGRQN